MREFLQSIQKARIVLHREAVIDSTGVSPDASGRHPRSTFPKNSKPAKRATAITKPRGSDRGNVTVLNANVFEFDVESTHANSRIELPASPPAPSSLDHFSRRRTSE